MRRTFRYLCRLLCLVLAVLMVLATGCRKDPTPPVDDPNPPSDDPNPPSDHEASVDKPTDLRINLLSQPFGVDKNDLRFSWVMNDPDSNEKQTAYRITVAETAAALAAGEFVHDSGWVDSAESTAIRQPALFAKLDDNKLYYWQVSLRDASGAEATSDAQAFTTAVGKEWASTQGIWAGKSGGSDYEISTDWTDYQMDVEFMIDANAVGFVLRCADKSNFYMWQFKVEGSTALLCPHVYQNGKFVNGAAIAKVNVPAEVAFKTGEMIYARIVCDGDVVETYIKDKNGDYVLVDERDMSEYGMSEGVIGLRTGGSESGKIRYVFIESLNDEGILYESSFEVGENPFSRCTIENRALIVPKGLSTGDLLDREAALDFMNGKSSDSFVFLRTEFALSEAQISKLDRALLSVTATSPESTRQFVYNMYVNGAIVGVGPSRYGTTPEGNEALYYNTYDVTSLLTAGDNCLAAINYTTGGRAFLSQLTLYYTDGTREYVSNSARDAQNWSALPADDVFGKDNSIGTTYYSAHANNIDTSLYPYGFATVGFDDADWKGIFVGESLTEKLTLAPSQTDNVSRYVSTETVTVKKLGNGDYVIDLGGEIVGGVRFTADLPAAATLKVYYGEQLNEDGSVKYQMLTQNVYEETWKLTAGKQTVETIDLLTYRYIQISGCPVEITPDMVVGLEVRAPFDEEASDFTSDNSLLNDIYELMKRTIKITTQDLFVDSQSRERLPYEGDLIINLLASYAFGNDYSIGRFSTEYLYTHRTWPAEYYLLAAQSAMDDYMTTGDVSSLEAYYDVLKERVYTKYYDEEIGLLTTDAAPGASSTTNAVLIDWPQSERDGYDVGAKYNTVLNAVAVRTYEVLAEIALLTGHEDDADAFAELAEDIKSTMISMLYDADKGAFADGLDAHGAPSSHFSQHATAYALAFGIYKNQEMADAMAATIEAQGEIRMSVYGSFFLLKGLYDSGNGDVANMLLLNEDVSEGARTWAYMLYTLNATVTAEAWNSTIKNNMTMSHAWGAAPAYAITRGIFGIMPTTPGYATFDVRFQTEGIGKASIAVPTIKGDVEASFDSTGATYTASVTVPANTKATIYLPATEGATLTVNGEAAQGSYKNGFISLTVGSGEWNFEVK